MDLNIGSSNYLRTSSITRADDAAVSSVTSATAFICLASNSARTPLSNSAITLSNVSGTVYAGTFPATVPLVDDVDHLVVVTIVADGLTRVKDLKIRPHRR